MKKYSRQREAVLRALTASHDHPTAAAIYASVRRQIPNISLGTVYRNLGQLVEGGLAIRVTTIDGTERFDGNPRQHDHFVCNACGSVIDVSGPPIHEVLSLAESGEGHRVDGYSLIFHGTCASCAAAKDASAADSEGAQLA